MIAPHIKARNVQRARQIHNKKSVLSQVVDGIAIAIFIIAWNCAMAVAFAPFFLKLSM